MKEDTEKKSPSSRRLGSFFNIIQKPVVEEEKKHDREIRSKWMPFFVASENVYPNDLALRARRSPTHGAILKSKHVLTKGKGFLYFKDGKGYTPSTKEQDWLDLVNNKDESLYDVFDKYSKDYIMFGNAYLEEEKINKRTNVYHRDATTVRVGKKDGKVYLSFDWRWIRLNPNVVEPYEVKAVNAFDSTKTQKRYIKHLKNYEPEFHFYGLPDHVGVLNWADIEYRIAAYNITRFDNGFFPSMYIALFGEETGGDTGTDYAEKVVTHFTGEGNNSKLFAEVLDSPELAAKIHEFSTVREGEFIELQRLAVESLISGHRWHASLAGLKIAGSLGDNEEVKVAFEIAMASVIIPDYQNPILKVFNRTIKDAGFDFTIGIQRTNPTSLITEINPEKIITVKEAREQAGQTQLTEGDERGDLFVIQVAPAKEEPRATNEEREQRRKKTENSLINTNSRQKKKIEDLKNEVKETQKKQNENFDILNKRIEELEVKLSKHGNSS